MVRFLRIDPMVNGSSPPLAKLSRKVRRVACSPYFQVQESRGLDTARGRTWTMLGMQKCCQCPTMNFLCQEEIMKKITQPPGIASQLGSVGNR